MRDGRPVTTRTPANTAIATATGATSSPLDRRHDCTANAAAACVTATRFKIGNGAQNDHLWVERCSLCSYAHRHVIPTTASGRVFERAPRCRPWTTYVVEVVKTVPLAQPLQPVPGQRRRGAAA
jgi:hypothetical protein